MWRIELLVLKLHSWPCLSIRSSFVLFNKNQLFRRSLLTKISLSKISIHLLLAFTTSFYKCLIWTLAFFCLYTLSVFLFDDIIASQFLNTILFLAIQATFWQQQNYFGVDLTPLHGSAYQGYFSQVTILDIWNSWLGPALGTILVLSLNSEYFTLTWTALLELSWMFHFSGCVEFSHFLVTYTFKYAVYDKISNLYYGIFRL